VLRELVKDFSLCHDVNIKMSFLLISGKICDCLITVYQQPRETGELWSKTDIELGRNFFIARLEILVVAGVTEGKQDVIPLTV
jgi:hypothetical protein